MSISGCLGFLPTDDGTSPEYQGGTVVIENIGSRSVRVSVETVEDAYSASFETTVQAGETVVRREFIAASRGAAVTLAAQLGPDGDPTTFEYLPNGGEDTPPEVARLTIENDVEASATWTATTGL